MSAFESLVLTGGFIAFVGILALGQSRWSGTAALVIGSAIIVMALVMEQEVEDG